MGLPAGLGENEPEEWRVDSGWDFQAAQGGLKPTESKLDPMEDF